MRSRCRLAPLAVLIVLGGCSAWCQAAPRPAVLFCGGVHAKYVAGPLVEWGIEVDTCEPKELAQRLQSGKYNVAVVDTLADAELAALDAFLAQGGGVLACNPKSYPDSKAWTAACQWLTAKGARPRWETLQDDDKTNVVRDIMNSPLSWSDQVSPPVAEGVPGVLTITSKSTGGWEPPMSFDLTSDWQVVVRGAASLREVREVRHDVALQPWLIQEGRSQPPLLALRETRPGRLAVLGVRYHWFFKPPWNCPTAEAMLTAGAGGRSSDWLRVVANSLRWLAEPSLQAGRGGATTPESILHPQPVVWQIPATIDWSKSKFPAAGRSIRV